MQLTKRSDLALRLLMYLALAGRSTTSDAARAVGGSTHHLHKIIAQLCDLEVLSSARGRSGGVELARDPREINIGAVFRALETSALVECFDPVRDQCAFSPRCGLRPVLEDAFEAFCAVLDDKSLHDLVRQKKRLRAQLELA